MKKITIPRSHCPISYTLEIVGDTWSLLIIRDIVFANKNTFNQFLQSDESIARNILSSRLKNLVEQGILQKRPHPSDRRKEIFTLTSSGMSLIPLILQVADWGIEHYDKADHFPDLLGSPPYTTSRNIQRLRRKVTASYIVDEGVSARSSRVAYDAKRTD